MNKPGDTISYQLIYSARKTLAIQINPDGAIIVRAPKGCSRSAVEGFVRARQDWIIRHLSKIEQAQSIQDDQISRGIIRPQPQTEAEYQACYQQAAKAFASRTRFFADQMQVSYGRITIRDQKTRWGSCSSKGNLNFNWRLILAPEAILDYVVVHELAHRFEMNHSPAFWQIVASVMPDYQLYRSWLRRYGVCLTDANKR